MLGNFLEKILGYKNRSDLVRKAVRNEMERDYNTLEELAGSWSEKEAEKAKNIIRKSTRKILRLKKMILDTNFLIDILGNQENALKELKEFKKKKEPLLLPPGALYELCLGGESEEEIKRIETELNRA